MDRIYKINEKPKFAYFVYTGEVEIISESNYQIGVVKEGELLIQFTKRFSIETG